MMHIENSKEFDEIISKDITLVDFYATWCGPCRMLTPIIEEVEEEYNGKIKIVKVDVDECGDIANRYNINAIPSILLFKDNELKSTQVGFMPKDAIVDLIEKTLSE